MNSSLHSLLLSRELQLTLIVAVALVGLYFGFRGLHRARLIEDTPTAKVRSAPQGVIELTGRSVMMSGDPVISPLSKIPCCWYRYSIEGRSHSKSGPWVTLESGQSDAIFILRDDTGDCIVDPEGAAVTSGHRKTWSGDAYGDRFHGGYHRLKTTSPLKLLWAWLSEKLRLGVGFQPYRFTETLLLDRDPLYAIGDFRSQIPADDGISHGQLTASILRRWKQQPEGLLARFDQNKDGQIDLHEWDQARQSAEQQARDQRREEAFQEPLKVLKKPRGAHYLLANLPQFNLVQMYHWQSRFGFVIFIAASSILPLV